jgi:hypothetical protein
MRVENDDVPALSMEDSLQMCDNDIGELGKHRLNHDETKFNRFGTQAPCGLNHCP